MAVTPISLILFWISGKAPPNGANRAADSRCRCSPRAQGLLPKRRPIRLPAQKPNASCLNPSYSRPTARIVCRILWRHHGILARRRIKFYKSCPIASGFVNCDRLALTISGRWRGISPPGFRAIAPAFMPARSDRACEMASPADWIPPPARDGHRPPLGDDHVDHLEAQEILRGDAHGGSGLSCHGRIARQRIDAAASGEITE